jgi:aconitate decarboxylase
MSNQTVTEILSEHICRAIFDSIDTNLIPLSKLILLDFLAVCIAGSQEKPVEYMIDVTNELGGSQRCSLTGRSEKSSPLMATFINGISGHILDFENMWHPATHPASPTIPAILALSECYPISGKDVILALIYGFEVQGRLRLAQPDHKLGKGLHLPGLVGVMGSAAASAILLNLTAEQIRMSFGIAASRACGLFVNAGTMTKSTHCGNAARAGLEAAMLAKRGFDAEPNIFDHPQGYQAIVGEYEFKRELVVKDFANPFRLSDPGIGFKKYPSHYATQYMIDAVVALKQKHSINLEEIDKIILRAPKIEYVNRQAPATGLSGKFSFQYTAVTALVDDKVGISSFHNPSVHRPIVTELLQKTQLIMDEEIPPNFNDMWVIVTIHMKDGSQLQSRCDAPHGIWGDPLTIEELTTKVQHCCSNVISQKKIYSMIESVMNLEQADETKVRELIKHCTT